jgi:hypothetical protein
MSEKLKKKLAETDKKYVIEDIEMGFLIDLDTIQRSFNYYQNQAKTNYLQQLAVRLGYLPTDQLEFSIDLKDPKKELTIKRIKD